MANSLRAKISKMRHDGNITEAEYQELIKKLDGHDAKVRTDAIDELSKEMHYCLHCGMGKDKSLEHLINLAEKLKEQK